MATKIQIRRGLEAKWISVNPVLADGEIAFVKDKNYLKVGDGIKTFTQLNKISGSDDESSDGKSAYQLAVQQGFEGSLDEWLQSLQGEQGEQGEQGIQGPKGDQGEQGPKGEVVNEWGEEPPTDKAPSAAFMKKEIDHLSSEVGKKISEPASSVATNNVLTKTDGGYEWLPSQGGGGGGGETIEIVQETGQSEDKVMSQKAVTNILVEKSSDSSSININQLLKNETNYTLETAIEAVWGLAGLAFEGIKVVFRSGDNKWQTWQYVYTLTMNESNFKKVSNWKQLDNADTQSIQESITKHKIFNVNAFYNNKNSYTLETAIAAIPENERVFLIGVRFLVDSSDEYAVAKDFEEWYFTYAGGQSTISESIFSTLSNWKQAGSTSGTTKSNNILEFGDITEVYLSKIPNQTITVSGIIQSTGQSSTVYKYDAKPLAKYQFSSKRLWAGGNTYPLYVFHDINNKPLFEGFNLLISQGVEYNTYEIVAPVDAAYLYINTVSVIGADTEPLYVGEQLNFSYEKTKLDYKMPKVVSSFNQYSYTAEIVTPLLTKTGYILDDLGNEKEDSRGSLFYYKNDNYFAKNIGITFGTSYAYFNKFGVVMERNVGKEPISHTELKFVYGAELIGISVSNSQLVDGGALIYKTVEKPLRIAPEISNNPLPLDKENLKVLCIGNSFSGNTFMYLPNILSQAGIDTNVAAYTFISGGELVDYANLIDSGEATIRYSKCTNNNGSFSLPTDTYDIETLIKDEVWDVVILQQRSSFSYNYLSFEPYMTKLIKYVRENVANPRLSIMFNMVWSGEEEYTGVDSKDRYLEIAECTRKMIAGTGIDYIIPGGTAVQIGRDTTELIVGRDWTVDGYHADQGVTCYTLAATLFQSLYGYVYGKDIRNYTGFTTNSGTPVTSENVSILNNLAWKAVANRFIP